LEKELELVTLNFLKKTTTTAKLVPQVIVILDSKEEVEVGLQPVVHEQPVPKSRPVEKYLSKNFLKKDLFPTLFFSAQNQK